MNWELFGIVLVWILAIYETLIVVINFGLIWEHNSSILTQAKLQGHATLSTRGQIDLIFMIIAWAFLGVYYFG